MSCTKKVRIASAHNIPFMATNGGHGTSIIYGKVTGIDINLANFNTTKIDLAKNHLIVGAGVKLGDITEPLYKAGKAVRKNPLFLSLFLYQLLS